MRDSIMWMSISSMEKELRIGSRSLSNPEVLQDQSTPRNDEAHGTEMSREECVGDCDSHGRSTPLLERSKSATPYLLAGDEDDSWVDTFPQKNMGGEGSVSRDHDHKK